MVFLYGISLLAWENLPGKWESWGLRGNAQAATGRLGAPLRLCHCGKSSRRLREEECVGTGVVVHALRSTGENT